MERKHKGRARQGQIESFARHYVALQFNGTQAAIAAGYSPRTAKVQASALLTKPDVKALVARFSAATIKKEQISVERTLTELARLAYVDPAQLIDEDNKLRPIHDLPPDVRACISGMETNAKGKITHIKMADKARALYMLCQVLKMFSEERVQDLGVKYVILDMPRPIRTVGSGAAALPAPTNGNGHNGNGNGNGNGSHG